MDRIGVRELRQNASRYLERVRAGETFEVTDRGELVALLIPPTPAMTARDRMIRDRQLLPAESPFQLPEPVAIQPRTPDSGSVLDELREDIV